METPDPSVPASSRPRRLPGGRLRTLVARALPRGVKARLRRRFHGSRLFPAPPPRPVRGRPGTPAAPAARVVRLRVPLAPVLRTDAVPPRREIVLEAPPGLYVPKRLAVTGLAGYERHALECFLTLLGDAPGGAVLDIGANVGLYALLAGAVDPARDVRAFEPTPGLAAVARAASARNGVDVVVEEIALGREAGTATFFLSDRTDSSNSLAAGYRPSSRQLEVAVETLDGYCARTGVVPAVLKVDTETTEPDVLAGAAATIAAHRPWILCEALFRRRTDELAEVMAPHGYTWYHLDGEADPRPTRTLDGDPTYANLMYLLAPEPVDAAFWERTRAWRRALEAAADQDPPAGGTPTAPPAPAVRPAADVTEVTEVTEITDLTEVADLTELALRAT